MAHEVRIVHRRRPYDKEWKLFLYFPSNRRQVHAGKAGPTENDLDYVIRRLKRQLDAKGYRVSVVAG